jgi:hypothetical protein
MVTRKITLGENGLRKAIESVVLKKGLAETKHSIEGAKTYVRKFNRADAEKNLNWALEFRRENRGS